MKCLEKQLTADADGESKEEVTHKGRHSCNQHKCETVNAVSVVGWEQLSAVCQCTLFTLYLKATNSDK